MFSYPGCDPIVGIIAMSAGYIMASVGYIFTREEMEIEERNLNIHREEEIYQGKIKKMCVYTRICAHTYSISNKHLTDRK